MASSLGTDASSIFEPPSTSDAVSSSESSAEKEKSKVISKRQWIFASVFGAAHFASAACISLQAPFYPEKAESKGLTPTEYGFVFGVFELTAFISSPLFGKYLTHLGPVFTYNTGLFVSSLCSCLFGLLDLVDTMEDFLILSFAVRIVEALGTSASITASFTIIAAEFPDKVATTFATLETFFGLGLIAGPTIGGFLYELGGYKTPFMVMGGVLISTAVVTYLILPDVDVKNEEKKEINNGIEEKGNTKNEDNAENNKNGIFAALAIPSVFLDVASIASSSMSIGFLSATLEPHLRQFGLSPAAIGGVFVTSGGMYAVSAPLIGYLCDKGFISTSVAICIGHAMLAASYLAIGPAPFFPNIPTILWLSMCGLIVHGFGGGLILVPAFVNALASATLGGFPEGLSTYAVISGLWGSSFALGAFIGPSIGGALFDLVGFRTGSLAVIATHVVLVLVHVLYRCFLRFKAKIYCQQPAHTKITDNSFLLSSSKGSSYASTGTSTP